MPLGIRGPLLLYNQGVVVLRFAVKIESSATCSYQGTADRTIKRLVVCRRL